jgi:hypothetical protein
VTAGRTAWFLGTTMMFGRRGPGGGDCDGVGGGRGGGGVVPMMLEVVGVAVAWTR